MVSVGPGAVSKWGETAVCRGTVPSNASHTRSVIEEPRRTWGIGPGGGDLLVYIPIGG